MISALTMLPNRIQIRALFWPLHDILGATREGKDTTHAKPRTEAAFEGGDHPQGSAVTVEPHKTRQTPVLEWDISPEGEAEVESVGKVVIRPPLGLRHTCAPKIPQS